MNPISAKCPKLSLRSDILVSPSNCRSSNQAYGSTCSLACARGFRLSGPSSTQCGKGGVWNQRANTVRCEGVYYNFSVPNRIKLQLKYRSSLIRYVEADWKRQSPHWRPILTFFFIFLSLGRTRKFIPPPWYKGVCGGGGGGLYNPSPEFLISCSISKRFCFQWKTFDLFNKMRYILWVMTLLEGCDVIKNGRHLGRHLGFYLELENSLQPR